MPVEVEDSMKKCPACGKSMKKFEVAGVVSYVCPNCFKTQKGEKDK